MFISKNTLSLIVALMVIALGVLGYQYYQSQQNSTDIQIKIGKDGLSIEGN